MRQHGRPRFRIRTVVGAIVLVVAVGVASVAVASITKKSPSSVDGGGRGPGQSSAPGPSRARLNPIALTVQGNHLVQAGRLFALRGVEITAFLSPRSHLRGHARFAYSQFGTAELERAKAYGANAIRYVISAAGLTKQSSWYDPNYLPEIASAIKMTRKIGLDSMITLNTEGPSDRNHCPLATASNEHVWEVIAQKFRHDGDVMFELYNEPFLHATPATWRLWLHGGQLTYKRHSSCRAVGMQTLVKAIRAQHADNVIVAPGLQLERTLSGVPLLSDPAPGNQIAYGIHIALVQGPVQWAAAFGNLAAKVPVIVTEWNPSSIWQHCAENAATNIPTTSTAFLQYLHAHDIGVIGYSFDVIGTLIQDFNGGLTSYASFACGVEGGGPGELLHEYFLGKPLVTTAPAPPVTTTTLPAVTSTTLSGATTTPTT